MVSAVATVGQANVRCATHLLATEAATRGATAQTAIKRPFPTRHVSEWRRKTRHVSESTFFYSGICEYPCHKVGVAGARCPTCKKHLNQVITIRDPDLDRGRAEHVKSRGARKILGVFTLKSTNLNRFHPKSAPAAGWKRALRATRARSARVLRTAPPHP